MAVGGSPGAANVLSAHKKSGLHKGMIGCVAENVHTDVAYSKEQQSVYLDCQSIFFNTLFLYI